MIWTLTKSGSTSFASGSAELSTLAMLHAVGVPVVIAYAIVQLIGTAITFTLNKYWVFGAGDSGGIVGEGAKSVVVFAGCFVLNTVLPTVAAHAVNLYVAYLASQVIVYGCWSFPMNRWWVFPQRVKLEMTTLRISGASESR